MRRRRKEAYGPIEVQLNALPQQHASAVAVYRVVSCAGRPVYGEYLDRDGNWCRVAEAALIPDGCWHPLR